VIVRRGIDWFAVELHVPSARLRKLAKRIDGLHGGKRKARPSGAATTASIGIKIRTARRCFYRRASVRAGLIDVASNARRSRSTSRRLSARR